MKSKFREYYAGKGCECYARSEGECGCGVDWTPSEVYELRKENRELQARIDGLEYDVKNYRGWSRNVDDIRRIAELEAEIKKLRNGNDVYFDPSTRNL
tara:strand:+ start:1062 stop:1355 length:294 start_codon:yes stop_codon:yes gene_type:complete